MIITALDHIVLAVPDLAAAEVGYAKLFGRSPSWRAAYPEQGTANVVFRLKNMAFELLAQEGEGPVGERLSAMVGDGAKLATLAFHAPDIARAHRRLAALGLDPSPLEPWKSTDRKTGRVRQWRMFRAQKSTHGLRLFVMDERAESPVYPYAKLQGTEDSASIGALDHVVVRTPDPERSAALFGARLGLEMRLDRTASEWGARLQFFRCGDLIVEVAHDLGKGVSADPDQLWGLSWRVANADAAQARLAQEGFNVSDVRTGRKPGTRIFTIRDAPGGVPTVCVEPAGPKGEAA